MSLVEEIANTLFEAAERGNKPVKPFDVLKMARQKQYLKNTQPGTTSSVLNVPETDTSGMKTSIYNNRQEFI